MIQGRYGTTETSMYTGDTVGTPANVSYTYHGFGNPEQKVSCDIDVASRNTSDNIVGNPATHSLSWSIISYVRALLSLQIPV